MSDAKVVRYDEFFISRKKDYGVGVDRRFSLLGLQFFSEFITESVRLAGLDPAKVTFRVGASEYYYDTVSIAYPSITCTLISKLTITDGKLTGTRRKTNKSESWNSLNFELLLADPNVQSKLADIIKMVIPKNSQYTVEKGTQ